MNAAQIILRSLTFDCILPPLISLQSSKDNSDIKEISFMIFHSCGEEHGVSNSVSHILLCPSGHIPNTGQIRLGVSENCPLPKLSSVEQSIQGYHPSSYISTGSTLLQLQDGHPSVPWTPGKLVTANASKGRERTSALC